MTNSVSNISFKQEYTGRANRLITPVGINQTGGGKADDGTIPYVANYNALWDTGATQSCISSKIVKDLGLNPVGKIQMSTAGGVSATNVYHISMKLPNRCYIEKLKVAEVQLAGCDALIGMDVISKGNFSISHDTGKTVFEFGIPANGLVRAGSNTESKTKLRGDGAQSPMQKKHERDKKRKNKLKAKQSAKSRKRNRK